MSARPSKPPPVIPARTREAARIASWAVGLQALVSALGALLAQHRGGSVVVQALVAEWGTGRLGVAWSDPTAPPPSTRDVARRAGIGALLGASAAVATLGLAWATHAAELRDVHRRPVRAHDGRPRRDVRGRAGRVLLRGLVLRTFRHTLPFSLQLVVCGLIAAAARAGQLTETPLASLVTTPASVASLAIASLGGVCFATLWLRDRGAWMACGAHAAWTVATTTANLRGRLRRALPRDTVGGRDGGVRCEPGSLDGARRRDRGGDVRVVPCAEVLAAGVRRAR